MNRIEHDTILYGIYREMEINEEIEKDITECEINRKKIIWPITKMRKFLITSKQKKNRIMKILSITIWKHIRNQKKMKYEYRKREYLSYKNHE